MFKTKNGWTKKKMVNVIKKKFKGRASRDGLCVYKEGTKRCAVGLFIPNNHPGLKVNGNASILLSEHPDLKKVLPLNVHALMLLQYVHDNRIIRKPLSEQKKELINWIEENVK